MKVRSRPNALITYSSERSHTLGFRAVTVRERSFEAPNHHLDNRSLTVAALNVSSAHGARVRLTDPGMGTELTDRRIG
jgi:hypothetical protein